MVDWPLKFKKSTKKLHGVSDALVNAKVSFLFFTLKEKLSNISLRQEGKGEKVFSFKGAFGTNSTNGRFPPSCLGNFIFSTSTSKIVFFFFLLYYLLQHILNPNRMGSKRCWQRVKTVAGQENQFKPSKLAELSSTKKKNVFFWRRKRHLTYLARFCSCWSSKFWRSVEYFLSYLQNFRNSITKIWKRIANTFWKYKTKAWAKKKIWNRFTILFGW